MFHNETDRTPVGELYAALDPSDHRQGMDMCIINPAYLGKKYRYACACDTQRPCNFPNTLTKIDLVKKKAKNWHEEGAVPSELFSIARPGAMEEDDDARILRISQTSGSKRKDELVLQQRLRTADSHHQHMEADGSGRRWLCGLEACHKEEKVPHCDMLKL